MAKLKLTLASSDYDHVRDFTEGDVEAGGIEINFLRLPVEEMFFRFLEFGEFDVSEVSSSLYTSGVSQGDDRFVAIPVFPSRVFRQSSLYVRPDSPLKTAGDLVGKRCGIPEWGQSAAVYTRGWLQHDIGIALADIDWVQAGVNQPGRVEKVDLNLPEGVKIERHSDSTLSEMLLAGDVDVLMTAHAPQLFEDGSPEIVRLFPNYREVEEAYYKKSGIRPIMHFYAIKREVFEAHPWVARNLYKAFEEAKNRSLRRTLEITASRLPFSWCTDEAEKARALFGDDFMPYGIEPNRTTLEAFLQYSWEHGLSHRPLKPEDLFPEEFSAEFKI
jgi:4,5-dihydroxyphthalate decarboxylase